MDLIFKWVLLFVVCVIGVSLSQDVTRAPMTDDMSDGMGAAAGGNGQKPPVWLKCMAEATGQDVSNSGIRDVFETWCSNYESIIQCLTSDLSASAESNPFDFFIGLEFDPDMLREVSKNYCMQLKDSSDKLTCSSQQNQTLATVCGHAFTRGMFHIYGLFKEQKAPQNVLSQIACDVTTQTTFCLRQTLTDCPSDVQNTLLNYYALFTNGSCIAGEDYQPPSPPQQRPNTVVVKCAEEASRTIQPDQVNPDATSVVDFVILGLKSDCKTYPARFTCYDRELSNITNFLDFWLSLTFDLDNALASQKAYCEQIDERVIPNLNTECFNKSQPALAACEGGFGQEVDTIRREWVQNADFDGVQLQTLACRTSVTRATCLGDAMKHCGDDVAKAMATSEMGILPDVCRQLLAPKKPMKSADGEMMDKHMGNQETPMGDMGYKSTGTNNGMDNTADGNNMNDDKNDNRDNGVDVIGANLFIIVSLLSVSFVLLVL